MEPHEIHQSELQSSLLLLGRSSKAGDYQAGRQPSRKGCGGPGEYQVDHEPPMQPHSEAG